VCNVALRKFAYEAFLIPTNGMAPTLLGEHWEAPCPRCGAPAYSSPIDSKAQFVVDGALMVCSKERRSVTVTDLPKVRAGGDRILVCKLLAPKRWDVAVFHYPAEPSFKYVQRIVGMPGEKLEIREGAVWIDGKKLDPPESIRGIHYSPTIESHGRTYSGPGSVPVELGPDEYFTLGDFADASSDSRLWENGAPGHPSYAVPESNIVGVVINIYWPPGRWTSFR
jgi:signal peptidase I